MLSPLSRAAARLAIMKALFLHAHYDDYEFTAAGTFELWRRKLGADFTAKVIVCTDGPARGVVEGDSRL